MKYSIITINYNNERGLERTMESVAAQTCRDFEYIVIDGKSTDGSVSVIERYADCVTYWESEPDKGVYHAMNKGLKKATGEYCLFLNSGDFFKDEEVMAKMLSVDYTEDIIIGRILNLPDFMVPPVGEISLLMFYKKGLPHQSTFIRKALLEEHGGYDESLKIIADMKFFIWALISKNCSYREIELCVACFDTTGISSVDRVGVESERKKVFESLFPPRIRQDYTTFVSGKGYEETDYDRLFVYVRRFFYGEVAYTCTNVFLRLLSPLKKSARIAWNLPLRFHRKK